LLAALSAAAGIAYFADISHVAFVTPFALPVLAGMVARVRTSFAVLQKQPARAVMGAAWVAVLAIVLVKGWTNRQLAWKSSPVLFDSAFGTLAGTEVLRDTIRDLREKLQVDEAAPPRLFSYPTDAWIYLALPADNPTPFCILRKGYNTDEQFRIAQEDLDRDPQALVLVHSFGVRPGDPFLKYLEKDFDAIGTVGYPFYQLYRRKAPS
jgi:hypothetical protein